MAELLKRLRERADWLRYEYLHGGNFEHLSAREAECRYVIELLEKTLSAGDGSNDQR
jgi:hypothetical protein